jgi:hypothetical protein
MGIYLERYQSGEYKQVWDDLILLDKAVLEPDVYEDAATVARETMKRVRHNVELLYERLIELKYKFEAPEYAFREAIPHERKIHLTYIEDTFGKLPLSLRMWYEEVGDVVFLGSHPLLSNLLPKYKEPRTNQPECCLYSDPFFCFIWEFDPKSLYTFTKADATGFVEFSPDYYYKVGVSGDEPLKLKLSHNSIDSTVYNFVRKIYFVDYLRWVFHWGAFPGFEKYLNPESNYKRDSNWRFPLTELSYLTDGLLEF